MAADKILMFTQRGLDLELGLPTEGGTFPKMTHMIICMGDVLADEEAVRAMTDWPDAHETKILLGGVQRYPNNEGAKILAHLPANFVLPEGKAITGIGIELSDGSKYTYAPYYQVQGGLVKPEGLALTIDVILSKRNAAALTVNYEPYDSLVMSEIVIQKILSEGGFSADKISETEEYRWLTPEREASFAKKAELSTALAQTILIEDEDTSEVSLSIRPGMNIYQFDNIWPTQNDYLKGNFEDEDSQLVQQSGWWDYCSPGDKVYEPGTSYYGAFTLPMFMKAGYVSGGHPFQIYSINATSFKGVKGAWGLFYDDEKGVIYPFGGLEFLTSEIRGSFISPQGIHPAKMILSWNNAATRFKLGGEIKTYNKGGISNG